MGWYKIMVPFSEPPDNNIFLKIKYMLFFFGNFASINPLYGVG